MIKLSDHKNRIRSNSLAQYGAAFSYTGDRFDDHWIALANIQFSRRFCINYDAGMTCDVFCYLMDQWNSYVRAPSILHAASGQGPEREISRVMAVFTDMLNPNIGKRLVVGRGS